MTIEFSLSKRQIEMRDNVRMLATGVIRPQSLAWDRAGGVPEEFLRNLARLATSMGSSAMRSGLGEEGGKEKKKSSDSMQSNLGTVLATEELSWADGALLLSLPGPGLGGPPVRATGTPEQKERFFGIFKDQDAPLRWGAYALTEPAAGSDVALRTNSSAVSSRSSRT